MEHHHHFDEYSMNDLRHTLWEVWRVIRRRRWLFIFPFCLAATAAFVGTHFLPREYTVSTTFERRPDPVLTNMGPGWTDALETVRQNTADDLADPRLWLAALAGPTGRDDGPAASRPARPDAATNAFLAELLAGLDISVIANDEGRDRVTVRLAGRDPQLYPAILARVRDKYIEQARQRTTAVLTDARRFFESQTQRWQSALDEVETRMNEIESAYPAVVPAVANRLDDEMKVLPRDIETLREQIREKRSALDQSQSVLASLRGEGPPDPAEGKTRGTVPSKPAAGDRRARAVIPNPEYAAVAAELEQIRKSIWEARNVRAMTPEHPAVVALDTKRAHLESQLAALTPTIETDIAVAAATAPAVDTGERLARAELEHRTLERHHDLLRERLAAMNARLADLECQRDVPAEVEQSYVAARAEAEHLRAEVAIWRQNIEPIARVLTVQSSNRGVVYAVLAEPQPALRPSAPGAQRVLFVCLAAALAIATLVVAMAELSDRSFRSVAQLSQSLGVPTLQAIDEIVTQAVRRQRLFRRLVVMPVTTGLMLLVTTLTGLAAYLSLENPGLRERILRPSWWASTHRDARPPATGLDGGVTSRGRGTDPPASHAPDAGRGVAPATATARRPDALTVQRADGCPWREPKGLSPVEESLPRPGHRRQAAGQTGGGLSPAACRLPPARDRCVGDSPVQVGSMHETAGPASGDSRDPAPTLRDRIVVA